MVKKWEDIPTYLPGSTSESLAMDVRKEGQATGRSFHNGKNSRRLQELTPISRLSSLSHHIQPQLSNTVMNSIHSCSPSLSACPFLFLYSQGVWQSSLAQLSRCIYPTSSATNRLSARCPPSSSRFPDLKIPALYGPHHRIHPQQSTSSPRTQAV